jgi:hypothetical protein
MKNKKLYPILFAHTALLIASLACNALAAPTPGASNFYMATDQEGTNHTSVFTPTDDFYVFFDVAGIEVGTPFQSRWYALNIEGEDPNTPFQTIDYTYEADVANIYFQLTSSDGWPTGNYKVEVYMNGTKVGEQQFSVQ